MNFEACSNANEILRLGEGTEGKGHICCPPLCIQTGLSPMQSSAAEEPEPKDRGLVAPGAKQDLLVAKSS